MAEEVSSLRGMALVRTLHRRYPHMIWLWEIVECTYCNAQPGQTCVTKLGRAADHSHSQRIRLYHDEMRRA